MYDMTSTNPISNFIANHSQAQNISLDDSLHELLNVSRKHLNMDVAFISEFTDGKRVFKYLDSGAESETIQVNDSDPLQSTYCKKIVDEELPQIISDTSTHPITQKLEVTKSLSIGAYIGVPIKLNNGQIYGTFCCYRHKPDKSLTDSDLSLLTAFSGLASKIIDKKLALEQQFNGMNLSVKSVLTPLKIKTLYQPIYSIKKSKITGYESLSRFSSPDYRSPDIWFNEANQVGLGKKLELIAVAQAIKGLEALPKDRDISINVSPELIIDGSLMPLLKNIPFERVILEITEHAPIVDYPAFRSSLYTLRQKGIRLAIDDAGAGYSTFQHILELDVDFIKLDISLIKNISVDTKRKSLATAILAFAKSENCKVVAEGVETINEFLELSRLGVDKVQGYFISHPLPIEEAAKFTCNLSNSVNQNYQHL